MLTNSPPPLWLLPASILQIAYTAVYTALSVHTQPFTQHPA